MKIDLHKTGLSLTAVLLLTGCNAFLDKTPDDRAQIRNKDDASELEVSAYTDRSPVNIFEIRSDNTSDKGPKVQDWTPFNTQLYRWDEQIPYVYQDTPTGYWNANFYAVAHSNQVLKEIADKGMKDADKVRGEALMCRAYNIFMLAQVFTEPYDPETASTKLGIPYPTEPEEVLIQKYERGNLQETYDNIVKDFEEGYKLIGDAYKAPKFHFTRQAAAAFGTRLYRVLGNWDRVIELGHDAFGDNMPMYVRHVNLPTSDYQGTYDERKNVWSHETENCNFLLAVIMSGWYENGFARYGVSIPLANYFAGDGKDVKAQNFLGAEPAIAFFGRRADFANIPKLKNHFRMTNKLQKTGFWYTQFVILSGDEVLFNMAEAYAMKGQFDKVRDHLQLFVSHFMSGYNPADDKFTVTEDKIVNYYKDVLGNKMHKDPMHGIEIQDFHPFYQTTDLQEAYIRACLDMKRICYVHDGMRWLDNRQYRMDIVHNMYNDKGTSQEFYVLRGNDPRYALQLPTQALQHLEKNPGYYAPFTPVSK